MSALGTDKSRERLPELYPVRRRTPWDERVTGSVTVRRVARADWWERKWRSSALPERRVADADWLERKLAEYGVARAACGER